jgi:outer membrane protein
MPFRLFSRRNSRRFFSGPPGGFMLKGGNALSHIRLTPRENPMRIKMFLLPALMLASLLLAGCAGKVAVIDPDLIFQDSEAVKSGMAYLADLSQELQEGIAAPPESGRKGRVSNAALQQRIGEAQQRYSLEQQQVMSRVNDLFLKALETCRLRGRFSTVVVTGAVLAYDPAMDITRKVMEEMNKTPLLFSPSPSPDGEKAPSPAQ